MSSTLSTFNEALERASDPINPPPAKPHVLDVPNATSSLLSGVARHWQQNSSPTPPNTAIDSNGVQWHPISPQLQDNSVSQNTATGTSQVDHKIRETGHSNLSGSFVQADGESNECALASYGTTSENTYSSQPQAITSYARELSQSKAPAADDLFSDIDDEEMPDLDNMDQDVNVFDMSDLRRQKVQLADHSVPNKSIDPISCITHVSDQASCTVIQDFAEPDSHPSPTESQLMVEDFEFHNQLSEEVQITRFNDKAVRKALRDVSSELSRKQQWYAWSKAKQMLNTEPESVATVQMEKMREEPLEKQEASEHMKHDAWGPQAQSVSLPTAIESGIDKEGQEDHTVVGKWVVQRQVNSLSSPASTGGFAVGQGDWHASREPMDQDSLLSKRIGSVTDEVGKGSQARKFASPALMALDQDRLSMNPLGPPIKKIIEEHLIRRQDDTQVSNLREAQVHYINAWRPQPHPGHVQSDDMIEIRMKLNKSGEIRADCDQTDLDLAEMSSRKKPKLLERRDGSAHGLLPNVTNSIEKEEIVDTGKKGPTPSTTTAHLTPHLPGRSTFEQNISYNSHYEIDLLRSHTNTIIRRSTSPSRSNSCLLHPISPNRLSPSPWIEHPGINRPDTPRPVVDQPTPIPCPHSNNDTIRQSVEPELPYLDLIGDREGTPAFGDRSPSPSPVSYLGTADIAASQNDAEMTDAASPVSIATPSVPTMTHHSFTHNSSPDPISSPIIHGGNTVTAPETPMTQNSPLRPPPTPIERPPSIKVSKRGENSRRKSLGGQISRAGKGRSVTAVQGSKVGKAENKSRNMTRKVTQMAQKVTSNAKKDVKLSGSKVADAVKKIEEGIAAAEGSPRRSGRVAARKRNA